MANPEHVEIVRRGTRAIAAWRKANPGLRLNLCAADLVGAILEGANLSQAVLGDAKLSHAKLNRAYLDEANLHCADLTDAQLRDAYLRHAKLSGAYLCHADFHYAVLTGADLAGADLSYAILTQADLTGANLSDADLSGIRFDQSTTFSSATVSSNTKSLGPWIFRPEKYILREIEFPPEYHQAGVGIMNYFATVLRQKYSHIPATVQIVQEELTVRMAIETDKGHREIIEQTLEDYGLVVASKQQPSEFLTDPVAVMGLQHKLDIAEMEVRHAHNQLLLANQMNQEKQAQIDRLETRMDQFQLLISEHLRHSDRLINVLEQQAFTPLRMLLDRGLTKADEAEVKRLLKEAEQQNPGMLQRLAEAITSGAIGGTIGSTNAALLAPWLQDVIQRML